MNTLIAIIASEDIDPSRSVHPILPHITKELIPGGLASLIVFGLLFKLLRNPVKNFFAGRTERIQNELDAAVNAHAEATADAAGIREGVGDVDGVRAQALADADEQAAEILKKGRASLEQEVADMLAKAEADIAAQAGRAGDQLRNQIAQIAGSVTDQLMADGAISDATHQDLIESFIQKVGAAS